MKKLYISFVLLTLILNFQTGQSQTVADGWVIESIHGPSQVGIVDSIPVDINNDGLTDVVSASIDDGHIRAYINQGFVQDTVKPVFKQQYLSKNVPGAYRITATDINNDGVTDFIVPSIETQEVIVLIAEGGVYRKQIIAQNILLPTDAQAGDFDGDGLMDVVSVSFEDNTVYMHHQKYDGSFSVEIMASNIMRPRKLLVADFNNDGHVDILLASSGDNSVRLYENQEGKSFQENILNSQMYGIRFITPCDVNGDLLIDFVASATEANTAYAFVNTGNSQFDATVVDSDLPGVNSLYCADIDNDQQQELVSIASQVGVIYAEELNGFEKQLIANTRDGYVSVNVADFDLSGQPLILTQTYFENRNLLYKPNQSNNELVVWEDFPDGISSVATGDISGDGIDDIVATSFRDDVVQWYDGLTFEHHIIAENIDGAADVTIADLDKNGFLDVLVAASNASTFYWHRNMGNAEFETIAIFTGAPYANSIVVADINGDTQLDVIGTSGSDDSVRWFNRDGIIFEVNIISQLNDAPNDVENIDVDNDGDVDLVVSNFFSGDISLFVNNNLSFTEIKLIEDVGRPYDVAILPGKFMGYPDILSSLSRDGQVVKFENMKNNIFNSLVVLDNILNPRSLIANDEGDCIVVTPAEQAIYSIKLGSKVPILTDFIGGASVVKSIKNNKIYTGSMTSGLLAEITSDVIFKMNFDVE